jgi:ribulose-bisphosphate carboxylase large chain
VKNAVRASYRLAVEPSQLDARVEALRHEQTVELPPAALTDPFVRDEILPSVEGVAEDPRGGFRVTIAYPELATALDPAQLLNVLFGNSPMHADVELVAVTLTPALESRLGGPRLGAAGLRALVGGAGRARARASRSSRTPPSRVPSASPSTRSSGRSSARTEPTRLGSLYVAGVDLDRRICEFVDAVARASEAPGRGDP